MAPAMTMLLLLLLEVVEGYPFNPGPKGRDQPPLVTALISEVFDAGEFAHLSLQDDFDIAVIFTR